MSPTPRIVRIALDPALGDETAEAAWVLRVLMRIAGYAVSFARHADGGAAADLYYGPGAHQARARVCIARSPRGFASAGDHEPVAVGHHEGFPTLAFQGDDASVGRDDGRIMIDWDLPFAAFWLLTGPKETGYPRDTRDNLILAGSAFERLGLGRRPLVSEWAMCLRAHLEAAGVPATDWRGARGTAAVAISHDVDYPEIIRWIEGLRGLAGRRPDISLAVARGAVDFWRFADWMDLSESLGTRSTFYFMARRGSLWRYLRGTPDAFYDVRTDRFASLFRELESRGHEVGIHLSYHAHTSVEMMLEERQLLEEACGRAVSGNRHHYWHLDPDDPEETLRRQVRAGLRYDSSLAFEFHPGFRRGIAHPFRPWDSRARTEMPLVEVPPAWMDDHFDRRTAVNGIVDADGVASGLVAAAARTDGIVVLDYHVRGMEPRLFPRYGPWLRELLTNRLDEPVEYRSMQEIVDAYERHEQSLAAAEAGRS